jgi:hypothetical protein
MMLQDVHEIARCGKAGSPSMSIGDFDQNQGFTVNF